VGVDALISGGMGEDAEVRLGQSRVARVRDGMLVVHEEVLQRPGRPGSRSPNH
jgi:hypothetical protein